MKDFITYLQESASTEDICKKIKNEIIRLKCLNYKSRWFDVFPDNSGKYIFVSVPGSVDAAYRTDDAINDFVTAEGYKYDARITSRDSNYVVLRYKRVS